MAALKRFYRLDRPAAPTPLAEGYEIERFEPALLRLHASGAPEHPPALLYLFWYLASAQRYTIYYVRHSGRIIHSSHVISRNPKFRFMGTGDFQIGPCWTAPDHRGRGIYPAVLARIARDHPSVRLWMFADEDNESSKRGIEKAGFTAVGTGVKRRGVYTITTAFHD